MARKRETYTQAELSLRLSPREARAAQRRVRKLAKAAPTDDRGGISKQIKAFFDEAREGRNAASFRPGRRGFGGKGVGRINMVEPVPELQGTSVQVCGMWPFVAGTGSPVVGVPLGVNLLNGSLFCADPISWFLASMVLNPSCFILGRPGLGKSSLVRHLVTVLQAWGITPMVLSDTKGEYTSLIRMLGGSDIQIGRGRSHINPLDYRALAAQLAAITDPSKLRVAMEEMRGRRDTTMLSLLALVRGEELATHEKSLITAATRLLDDDLSHAPVIVDLIRLIDERPPALAALARDGGDRKVYDGRVRSLVDDLTALDVNGPFGDIFGRPSTVSIEMGVPMSFDMSSIDDAELTLQAAVQTVCWNLGSAVVSADKHMAEAGLHEQRHYFLVMDELWRMLRASPALVFFIDALTRLNRQRAIGQALITHTMNDLELATDQLTKIAWGFVERSAMVYMGGLAESEMGNLETVFAMSSREKSMITDWSAEGGMNPETNKAAAPPGLGKFLMKIGKRPGTPFQVMLTDIERDVNNTNLAWMAAAERAASAAAHNSDEVAA